MIDLDAIKPKKLLKRLVSLIVTAMILFNKNPIEGTFKVGLMAIIAYTIIETSFLLMIVNDVIKINNTKISLVSVKILYYCICFVSLLLILWFNRIENNIFWAAVWMLLQEVGYLIIRRTENGK